jgi:hypothetical protein
MDLLRLSHPTDPTRNSTCFSTDECVSRLLAEVTRVAFARQKPVEDRQIERQGAQTEPKRRVQSPEKEPVPPERGIRLGRRDKKRKVFDFLIGILCFRFNPLPSLPFFPSRVVPCVHHSNEPERKEVDELTDLKCSSKHCATTPLILIACSCANKVRFVMTGFELNVRPWSCCPKYLLNVFGSTPTSGGGRSSPSLNGGGAATGGGGGGA